MSSRRHSITAEIEIPPEVFGTEDHCIAEIEIEFDFTPGCPARIRYDHLDHPAEGPEVEYVGATLLKGFDCNPTKEQVEQWGLKWFESDRGKELAIEKAQEDHYDERD